MSAKLPKVIKVIDSFNIVINKGDRDGITVGQRFLVFGLGEELADPDTGEPLGVLELVRGRGEVVHVQEKMATLRCIEKTSVPKRTRRIREPLSIFRAEVVEEIGSGEFEEQPFDDAEVSDLVRPI